MAVSHRERGRYRIACQPCSLRKVRCDRDLVQPCSHCVRRGQPELCNLGSQSHSRARPHHASGQVVQRTQYKSRGGDLRAPISAKDGASASLTSSPGLPTIRNEPMDAAPDSLTRPAEDRDRTQTASHIAEPSMVMFIRHQAIKRGYMITDDLSSMLGLHNIGAVYPFQAIGAPDSRWEELKAILPRPDEIRRFEAIPSFYRDGAATVAPVLQDYDVVDARICTYLEDYASHSLKEKALDSDDAKAREFFATVGFVLAALAAGSQFSAVTNPVRRTTTQNFISKAFHCLRMSNFLLRPTVTVIQTYLLIVIVVQNESQPEGAWALLGTVTRLAQSISLHVNGRGLGDPRESTWRALISQDCLLSMCYGRAIGATETLSQPIEGFDNLKMSYPECLWHLSSLALLSLRPGRTCEDRGNYIHQIQHLQESFQASTVGTLQTTKQKSEGYGFQLYSSFVVSFLCQQQLRSIRDQSEQTNWCKRLINSLRDTITSFLGLSALSIVPFRMWTMKHMALSSAFLLSFRINLKRRPNLSQTVEALINCLSTMDDEGGENASESSRTPHARALAILREACSMNAVTGRQGTASEGNRGGDNDKTPREENFVSGGNDEPSYFSSLESITASDIASNDFWDEEFFSLLAGAMDPGSNNATDMSTLDHSGRYFGDSLHSV